ncbi:MAG: DUF3859 domain-containing protein [Pararhodobacter sp.]
MTRLKHNLAGPALVAGFCLSGTALAQPMGEVSPRIAELTLGLFCAPPEGDRRPAPGTMSGWVHVPEDPVEMVARGVEAPALLGMGFGVRYRLTDMQPAVTRYTVTHPPMPPSGTTVQSWEGGLAGGSTDSVFFQFDIPDELQPGDWSFTVEADGELLFSAAFTVRPPSELPELAQLCRGGALFSLNRTGLAAAG